MTQILGVGEAEHRYDAVVVAPDGEFFVDTNLLVDYDPQYLTGSVTRWGCRSNSTAGMIGTPSRARTAT